MGPSATDGTRWISQDVILDFKVNKTGNPILDYLFYLQLHSLLVDLIDLKTNNELAVKSKKLGRCAGGVSTLVLTPWDDF